MIPKLGVRLETLRPELIRLEPIVDLVYSQFRAQAIVTSTNDSKHKVGSLHYKNAAFDLRIKHIFETARRIALFRALREQVKLAYPDTPAGAMYDVVLEDVDGPNAHIHMEVGPTLVKLMEGME